MTKTIREDVKNYYGNVLETNKDLKTSACCPSEAPPTHIQDLLKNVHETVQAKFYGCGTPLPKISKGSVVLDLGCGTGRDVYVLSQIVGEQGRVIGVDMTDEQLCVANDHINWHMDKFGYKTANVEFKKGYIEDLQSIGIEDGDIDLIVSNCVINLSADKPAVFKEIARVLKSGGELYFADVFAGQQISEELQRDPVLLGECLSGALTIADFESIMADCGMSGIDYISKREMTLDDPNIKAKIGHIDFYSITVRAFKGQKKGCC
ncbi:MAG: methyltransferase type 11 [Zetaproteobacteria bacterium]|nr:MAG: methyltransferase type 11 [Zetaproteobacteria bacterium]